MQSAGCRNRARVHLVGPCLLLALTQCVGCRTTIDSLGYNNFAGRVGDAGDAEDAGDAGSTRRTLHRLTGPSDYPNALRDVCGQKDADIHNKIDNAWNTVFHGSSDYTIYFEVGSDQANIQDIFHNNEVRTEGMGLAMMIAVEYNKRYEFDKLWRYAKYNMMVTSGAARGYFNSYCDTSINTSSSSSSSSSTTRACWDPYGLQQFAMALVLAHGRWGEDDGDADADVINYNDDAFELFDVMRKKEEQNGGPVSGITNTFDANTLLVFDEPIVADFNFTRPAIEMPAYYEMWAQATDDTFWTSAAANARGFWKSVANTDTGLVPVRAYFSGTAYDGWNVYAPEGYRVQLNMAWDTIWTGADSWNEAEANQLIEFFSSVSDVSKYAMVYGLDGTVVNSATADAAIIPANGTSALIASSQKRDTRICDVWNMSPPHGDNRYYSGLLYMLSLLTLAGEFRVY